MEAPRAMVAAVEVAVAAPLRDALLYALPADLEPLVEPGMRVRVPLGRRSTVGYVLRRVASPDPELKLRPVERLLDAAPVLPRDLLELATFTAEYYLAPIGEVLRAMLPSDLAAWGERRVWLTPAGAIAPARDATERAIVEVLLGAGRLSLGELHRRLALDELPRRIEQLLGEGRLAADESGRRGTRYVPAVELGSGSPSELLARCGRSPAGRGVVDLLQALGRPAKVEELQRELGCGPAVVRRLVRVGVLRQFTQAENLSLDRHLLRATEDGEPFVLREDQAAAVRDLTDAVRRSEFASFVLEGMTGSGKTEVYLAAVEATLAEGRSAILLVPEIALVPSLARVLERRFGDRLALLHSGLGGAERRQEWERIRGGEASVVLGPRSAVFAPLPKLGLVVVDEEHDLAYKQDSSPRYHGRDLALVRARAAAAVAVLVSATPSLESRYNVQLAKHRSLRLTARVGSAGLPEGQLIDLRAEPAAKHPFEAVLSRPLVEALESTLAAGDQAILFRNRRGYAPLLLCRACGEDLRCEDCGLPRTLHRRAGARLVCHYCGSSIPLPERCPRCGGDTLEPIGAGTERVEERLREILPGVGIAVLDRDAVRREGSAAAILERFATGEVRVLIGTQMVSKGHHFPRVALAAVLTADAYLGFPDFRAVEKTYSLLTQLAGRSGRGNRPGKVLIQTYRPDHYAIQAALTHDDERFVAEELRFRRLFQYPPFARMVQLVQHDRRRERAEEGLAAIARGLHAHPDHGALRILGPAPAPLERLRGEWRFQLLVRGPSARLLREVLAAALPARLPPGLVVDVDPYHLL